MQRHSEDPDESGLRRVLVAQGPAADRQVYTRLLKALRLAAVKRIEGPVWFCTPKGARDTDSKGPRPHVGEIFYVTSGEKDTQEAESAKSSRSSAGTQVFEFGVCSGNASTQSKTNHGKSDQGEVKSNSHMHGE